MDEVYLARHFAGDARVAEATAACLTDEVIAAYAQGATPGAQTAETTAHLAECMACRARLGRTVRLLRELAAQAEIPPQLLLRGQRVADRSSRKPVLAPAASVAVLGLTALWAGFNLQTNAPAERETRMLDNAGTANVVWDPGLRVTSESVGEPGLNISWHRVDGALYYDVRVVDAGGDVVAAIRTTESTWTLSGGLELQAGALYYVRVDARLSANRVRSSRHVPYRFPSGQDQ